MYKVQGSTKFNIFPFLRKIKPNIKMNIYIYTHADYRWELRRLVLGSFNGNILLRGNPSLSPSFTITISRQPTTRNNRYLFVFSGAPQIFQQYVCKTYISVKILTASLLIFHQKYYYTNHSNTNKYAFY